MHKHGLRSETVNIGDFLVQRKLLMEKMDVFVLVQKDDKWSDRGGFLKEQIKKVRRSPCESPFNRLFFDWTGEAFPCCNLRGDIENHRRYILGMAQTDTMEEMFFSQKSNKLRKHLAGFSEKEDVCKTCQYATIEHSSSAEKLLNNRLYKVLQ